MPIPENHEPLGSDGINLFSRYKGELYWNGETIKMQKKISLRRYEVCLATLATIATLMSCLALWLANLDAISRNVLSLNSYQTGVEQVSCFDEDDLSEKYLCDAHK